ncbi:1-aminocyclopropane-1-carboxylate deaminase/D-cysteine desulfhydrase [Endozoicomonadaceae bacterium StTr2]
MTVTLKQLLNARVEVNQLKLRWLAGSNIQVDMLRLDQLHPQISGNKWYKLKGHLQQAERLGISTLLSFGGAWSNHIHALAAAGKHLGFKTIGVIRGEKPKKLSATLQDAEAWGMQLHFVNRADYRQKHTEEFQQQLLQQLQLSPDQVLIAPEGGSGDLGVSGCEDILAAGNIDARDYQEIWLACGTGATLSGIARSAAPDTQVRGIAVLKGADFLRDDIKHYSGSLLNNWILETDYHCGGYGKVSPELLQTIDEFEQDTGIPLDQVYTGKMVNALKQKQAMLTANNIQRILLVHTGGLQGRRGMKH